MFLGPSLPVARAAQILAAEYHPPIRRGDLPALAGPTPRTVCIIDGEFFQRLAVTPQEILATMTQGHVVVGAASMGALRGAELCSFGMRGIGQAFVAFRDGVVERDDEVAVTFDADGGRAVSEALIGMRVAFAEAVVAGRLTPDEADRAVDVAQALHFTRRTYPAVLHALELDLQRLAAVAAFLADEATNLKAADAIDALTEVAAGRHDAPGRPPTTAPRWRARPGQLLRLDSLPPAPKCPGVTSVRSRDAHVTDELLRELGPRIGITRVADVTQLDTLGIPCFTAVRPGLGPSVYSGKALTPIDARVGAQMEALETAAAFAEPDVVCRGTYPDAARHGVALDPVLLPVCNTARVRPRDFVDDWVRGSDLLTGAPVLVPAAAVHLGLIDEPPWYVSSNGLASGNCATEAVAHGLAEVIERDALCLHDIAVAPAAAQAFLRVLAEPPDAPRPAHLPGPRQPDSFPNVVIESLPGVLRGACAAITAAGAQVVLRVLTSDIAVPTFACLIAEDHGEWGALSHTGSGTHPDALVAARRAITEAAQCRATYIQGVREDLPEPALVEPEPVAAWWAAPPSVEFGDLPSDDFVDVADDVAFMVERLRAVGLERIVTVDLGDPDWPVSVVKTIVGGAEAPLTVDGHEGPWFGWRARRALGLGR